MLGRSSDPASSESPAAASSTIEDWARAYIESTEMSHKCRPPEAPALLTEQRDIHSASCLAAAPKAPGRPAELRVGQDKSRSVSAASLVLPENRARLLHTFWHHELQAAELMCWALLRFADAEVEFRRGLLRVCRDEVRHMGLYQQHIEALGFRLGEFPVRDWFWERVPTCESKLAFVALMGMGLEAANLEHTARFAQWFEGAGDQQAAELQRRVGREEVAHVRFGVKWFRRWAPRDDFETWSRCLPKPLTPLLMRGKTIDREARRKAQMHDDFIDELAAWLPGPRGRT